MLEDPSGIPYHYFREASDTWAVEHWGTYIGPIDLFATRCQPDLVDASKAQSRGKIAFRYGYHPSDSIVIARRKPSEAIRAPEYTATAELGTESYCVDGKLVVTTK